MEATLGEQEITTFTSELKKAVEVAAEIGVLNGILSATIEITSSDDGATNIQQLEETDQSLLLHDSDKSDDSSNENDLNFEAMQISDGVQLMLSEGDGADTVFDSIINSVVELVEILFSLKETFSLRNRTDQGILANQIFSIPKAIEGFYGLTFNLFEFTQGLSSEDSLVQLYLLALSNIECWVDVSHSLCEKLVQGGMLLQNINDLQYLGKLAVDKSEILQSAVETNLSIIYNCARNHPLPNFYCKHTPWAKIFSSWANSPNDGLRITCKLLASILSTFLPEKDLQILDMSDNDLSSLMAALENAVQSPDSTAKAFGYSYTTLELLNALQYVSCWDANFQKIASALLAPLTTIIQTGQLEEKIASLKMLWGLLQDTKVKDILKLSHKAALEQIERELLASKDKEAILWSEGVLATMQDPAMDDERRATSLLATLKCCYALGRYSDCEKLHGKTSHSPEASLLKGKALYHIYQKMQRQLRMSQNELQPKEFFTQHRACYDVAKEAIQIFLCAKDDRNIEMDPGCNQMLDFSIMDYLLETNKLKDINRCFLCLKRPQAISGEEKAKLMETDGGKEKQAMKAPKRTIHASHLIPHSVIKRLANSAPKSDVAVADTKNILFGVSGTKLENIMKRTPGTSTVYMLCSLCEHILNIHGEQSFLNFFEKVYKPLFSDVCSDVKYAYGNELYHFCVGLVFRTLCPSQDEYINSDEVYRLLLQCRAFLTADDDPLQTIDNTPEVFMFLCSSEQDNHDENFQAFLTEGSASYTAKISLDCQLEELGTFESVFANFFLVKLGLIIIIVKFSPAVQQPIDKSFWINPEGGTYSIPANKARQDLIPTGVWTVLYLLYESYKTDMERANPPKEQ